MPRNSFDLSVSSSSFVPSAFRKEVGCLRISSVRSKKVLPKTEAASRSRHCKDRVKVTKIEVHCFEAASAGALPLSSAPVVARAAARVMPATCTSRSPWWSIVGRRAPRLLGSHSHTSTASLRGRPWNTRHRSSEGCLLERSTSHRAPSCRVASSTRVNPRTDRATMHSRSSCKDESSTRSSVIAEALLESHWMATIASLPKASKSTASKWSVIRNTSGRARISTGSASIT
mmetsp:Transcript_60947/g.137830  ORF Transcript_60947/g.137830 Transcript_60947/m.137830 type:complete len:231 (-) Transcript_60947:1733-2425(-)